MKIAVLIACHNRRETTLQCLSRLSSDDRVYLVDDGSTDGTAEAVGRLFPQVKVIRGDGSLYWAKGMATAWTAAVADGVWDGFLWLNDDTDLFGDYRERLLESAENNPGAVVVGEIENLRGEIVYGRRGDLFTGNFVYVPWSVYGKVGMICGEYSHAWADSDYALRCRCAGVAVVGCGVVGRCEGHPNRPLLKGLGLRDRWRMLWNPKGWCVRDLWLYRRRNWGVAAAVFSCAHLILHVLKGER